MKNKIVTILAILIVLALLFFTGIPADAAKPPWAGGPGGPKDYEPPGAPEPLALILIGMGVSGVAGYYLGKRKKR